MITQSIEINRRPEEVFAYLDQYERHGEWQTEIVSTKVETDGPAGVGTKVREIRRMGGREQDASYEITAHDPPRRSAFRGGEGPVRPVGAVTVEPAGDGSHRWLGCRPASRSPPASSDSRSGSRPAPDLGPANTAHHVAWDSAPRQFSAGALNWRPTAPLAG